MRTPGRVPRDAFADRLSGLDTAEAAAFVGDLYRASGWDVDGDGRVLELRRHGDPSERRSAVVVSAATDGGVDDAQAPDDPDLVIGVGRSAGQDGPTETGAQVVGPDELYDRLFYAVDRGTADALCREYFGGGLTALAAERSVTSTEPATGDGENESGGGEGTTDPGRPPTAVDGDRATPVDADVTRARLIGGLAILTVLLVAAAGASGGFAGTPFASPIPTDDAGSVGTTRTSTAPTATPGESATRSPEGGADTGATGGSGTGSTTAAPDSRYLELTPTCERPPELVAVVLVGAFRANDPSTNDGIRTAWNFSSRESAGSTYDTFAKYVTQDRFEPLFDHRSAEYAEVYREPGIAAYRVTLTDGDGARHPYFMAFSNEAVDTTRGSVPSQPVGDACWRLAGIIPE